MAKSFRNINIGNKGEEIAKQYLIDNGYIILHQNWRHKHWEIDIICKKGNLLHFVEVKTRTNNKFGYPEEAVTQKKMNALKRGAEEFLLQNEKWQLIQFDIVAITLEKNIIKEIYFIEDLF
jgi:putative endonuclease